MESRRLKLFAPQERIAEIERTKTELRKMIAATRKEVVEERLLLWFLERAFTRMSAGLRKKDKDLIESSVPDFITPQVIQWEELIKNLTGD